MTIYLNKYDDIKNIFKAKSTEELIKIIRGKKPLRIKKFIKNENTSINKILQNCSKAIKQINKINVDNKELEKDLNLKENKFLKINKKYENIDLKYLNSIEKDIKFLNEMTEEQVKIIEDNYERLINSNGENWSKHISKKNHDIKNLRQIVINNYAVRLKKFIHEDLQISLSFKRLSAYIKNKLNRRSQNIIRMFKTQNAWKIFSKVFPCLMMNPDHVSKIFPNKSNIFEYAIFDEASQIRLHRAIPTLHRSIKAIVAGDDKQLGPTDLFTNLSRPDDNELNLYEDTSLENDTLLNYAKDKYYSVHLRTHYRSKSKDLIEFSNNEFYDGEIMIADFPKPSIDGQAPIIVEEIGGAWQETRVNFEEAKRASELANNYINKGLSVLVITFNDQQKKLIADNLISKNLNSKKIMLKAIKDVQGDEMDVVIFSITYGKRTESKKYVNYFGQFSKEKINVAITRAKYRIHVLKSLPSSEIIVSGNDDKRVFRDWLEFIEKYSQKYSNIDDHKNTFRSEFEEDYFDELTNIIDSQYIPLANYKIANKEIDIVIYDSKNKFFIGAIELDGGKYHSNVDDVLRDHERQLFLENIGWKFVRTSFFEFYSNRAVRVTQDFTNLIEQNKLNIQNKNK